ncbi:hypothetical protein FTUN_3825 [Frigoriglobus tundricola]|uniref:Lipoprotein n=2 Tax=Frigoriglobus tundricola TaxID=2774151 RepID=A0A6M5YQQ5_9BACT|nr:hypothetical protein FTUN_3825 [Frigoriglobus tundricola]
MSWLGGILAFATSTTACAWGPGATRAADESGWNSAGASAVHCQTDEQMKVLEAAGRKADAEYKQLERDYMIANTQARILIAAQKAALDELAVSRKRNAVLEDEQLQRLIKALRRAKQ